MEDKESNNINIYVNALMNDKYFLKEEYCKYVRNCYGIDSVSRFIESEILKKAIIFSKKNKKMRIMLSDILLYTNDESVTDENFRMLLKTPKKYRNTYLSNLGHSELAFYQVQILNRYPLALESFCWLFDSICRYDCFYKGDMLLILKENVDVRPVVIKECIDSALENYGFSDKIEVAQQWLDKHKNI